MKTILAANVPGITITGAPTDDSSGAFELVVEGVEQPLHSKLNGDGYLDADMAKLKVIIAQLKELTAQ